MTNDMLGIVFTNVHDELIHELTAQRSMASVPFGGRYRLIDFTLSNLVNAGVSDVGIITKANYRSLMDHIGSGKFWDLDRKVGGLVLLPPYSTSEAGIYEGQVGALIGILEYLKHAHETYVALCDADVISNLDLAAMLRDHVSNGADVTVAYKHGPLPRNLRDLMSFDVDETGRIRDIRIEGNCGAERDYSLDIIILERRLLIELVEAAASQGRTSFARDILQPRAESLRIFGRRVDTFAEVIDSAEHYVAANLRLLDRAARRELFTPERPIYTKIRDNMPTRYGLESKVSNALIADGCVIEGEVENCILFREVTVGKGAVLRNCIVMQGSEIGAGASLSYATLDKNVKVSPGAVLQGTEKCATFVRKGAVV